MNLFSMELDKIHLGKNIRLFEAFSGIGTQAMALKRLGVNVEHVGFSEIDKYAIQSYVSIHGDIKNYGDITKMTEIPPCDIFTWSFPCTDLSKAGKQKGLSGTRSGLAYEVIRLLKVSEKPKVLLMENVPDLLGSKFRDGWQEIYHEIESLGYTNYVEVLNAKNYGVAQNRDRVFMVSILGEYAYEFPKPFKLEKRLKDYLEDEVDEKYYLDEKTISRISNWKAQQNPLKTMERTINTGIVQTLTARGAGEEHSGMVLIKEPKCLNPKVDGKQPSLQNRIYDTESISTAVTTGYITNVVVGGVVIPEATKQGYAVAQDGDGVYINRPHQKRGVVQKGMIQTIKTSGDDIGVVVDSMIIDIKSKVGYKAKPNSEIAPTQYAQEHYGIVEANLRIRKLTPLETWRLMSINDEDFYKAQSVVSNSQLYKQAGNSIVVDVLVEIFRGLL